MAFEPAGVQLEAQGASAFSGDMAAASSAVNNFSSSAQSAGSRVGAFGEIMTGALRHIGTLAVDAFMAAGRAALDFAGDSVSAARDTARLMASTEQTIKTMGNAAGRSAQQVADMATALSDASGKSLFGDDQIQQASNLLLTFGNIKGETFDLATALTVDLAQALGGAPKDQAMMLGKALQDPIKGITALGKAGLTFSAEQKEMIKAMVESGDVAGAQALIIEELNKQVGGQAEAAAKAAGGMVQFKARMGEVGETIATSLLPLLNQFGDFLNTTIAPAVEKAAAAFSAWIADPAVQAGIQQLIESIGTGLSTAFSFLSSTISTLVGIFTTVSGAFQEAGDFALGLGGAINALLNEVFGLDTNIGFLVTDALTALIDTFTVVTGAFQEAGDFALGLGGAINALLNHVFGLNTNIGFLVTDALTSLIAAFTDAQNPVEGFLNVLSEISPTFALLISAVEAILPALQEVVEAVFSQIATFIESHGDEIVSFMQSAWEQIDEIVGLAIQLIQATVVPALQEIASFIQAHGADIQNILSGAWQVISNVIQAALTLIKGLLTAALQAIQGDWSGAWTTIQNMSASFVTSIGSAITGFLSMIAALFGTTLSGIADTWSSNWNNLVSMTTTAVENVVSIIMSLPDQVVGVGAAAVQAIADGFMSAWNGFIADVQAKLQELADQLPFSEPKDPDSPLRGLIGRGRAIAEMLQQGMNSAGPLSVPGLDMVSPALDAAALRLGGGSQTTNYQHSNTYNYSPTYGRAPRAPATDFQSMKAFAL